MSDLLLEQVLIFTGFVFYESIMLLGVVFSVRLAQRLSYVIWASHNKKKIQKSDLRAYSKWVRERRVGRHTIRIAMNDKEKCYNCRHWSERELKATRPRRECKRKVDTWQAYTFRDDSCEYWRSKQKR